MSTKAERKKWPKVEYGDWSYVYISGGHFEGKFGYYDDEEEGKALIYFGAPLIGDGPYDVKRLHLRKPSAAYCKGKATAF